ncbi:MAG: DUF3408 domain-containing protein [Draconibacterium sp.]
MDSKYTKQKRVTEQSIQDWMPTGWKDKSTAPGEETKDRLPRGSSPENVEEGQAHTVSGDAPKDSGSEDTGDTVSANNTQDTVQTGMQEPLQKTSKRTGSKQRKESLEQYRETFLQVPKLEDRKPVFVSREVRDSLDEIVRRLGGRRMSVSGFVENLARHHLKLYHEDVETWKKL